MFINTAADFPEGAILKVSFRLAKSNHPIDTRCEVRYCLSGVGIGVEFVDMHPDDQKAIAKETHTPGLSFKLPAKLASRKQPVKKESAKTNKKRTTKPKKR
jgi:PilZ domain